jgi:hypothetical protein
MSCCDESTARVPDTDVSRRSVLKGAALIASVVPGASPASAQGKPVKLAYCSQLLCGVPYEVARSANLYTKHGLNVELVYTRGGTAAMQALVGGAVDFAATALDVAIQAYANVHADIRRFAVTGQLPLFALVTAPKTATSSRTSRTRPLRSRRWAMPIMRWRCSCSSRRAPMPARLRSPPWGSICSKPCGRGRSTPGWCRSRR